jgi:hypothetical protein
LLTPCSGQGDTPDAAAGSSRWPQAWPYVRPRCRSVPVFRATCRTPGSVNRTSVRGCWDCQRLSAGRSCLR